MLSKNILTAGAVLLSAFATAAPSRFGDVGDYYSGHHGHGHGHGHGGDDYQSSGGDNDDDYDQSSSGGSGDDYDQSSGSGDDSGDYQQGSSDQYQDDGKFKQACVDSHNYYRRQHGVPDVSWDPALALIAKKVAATCIFEHSHYRYGDFGENLATGYNDPTTAIHHWGDERKQYSYSNGGFSSSTGHFTQVVWKDTTKVGCAHVSCGGNGGGYRTKRDRSAYGTYLVCEYSKMGNVEGEYQENVPAPNSGSY